MTCYNCHGPHGTLQVLCPDCRVARAETTQSIRIAISQGHIPTVRAEQTSTSASIVASLIKVGTACALIFSAIKIYPYVSSGGLSGLSAEQLSAWEKKQLYTSCVDDAINKVRPEEFDLDTIRTEFEDELREYTKQFPDASKSKLEQISYILRLKADRSCRAAHKLPIVAE